MPGNPVRYGASQPFEPVIHDLPPLQYRGELVAVRLEMWRAEDGTWRGRLLFGPGESAPATTDIFCTTSESDLWEALNDLRDHHLRDLYRSVTE